MILTFNNIFSFNFIIDATLQKFKTNYLTKYREFNFIYNEYSFHFKFFPYSNMNIYYKQKHFGELDIDSIPMENYILSTNRQFYSLLIDVLKFENLNYESLSCR